jgi:GntR family transcriptional regulator
VAGRDLPAAPVADGVAAKSACYKDLGESWVPFGDLIMGMVSANFAGEVSVHRALRRCMGTERVYWPKVRLNKDVRISVSVLEGNEDLPGYRRLAISLAEEIQTGRYGSETALPTDSELMLKYGLGRQTVRRAFQELVADGLVYRVRGRGTIPTTRPKSGGRTVRSTGSIEALEEWSGTEMEVISPLELRRDLEYAQRLELDEPAVARLTVRRWIDDEPFAVTDIFLPPDVGSRLVSEDKIPTGRVAGTILAFVGAMAGPVASADETVTAIAIPASLAETLHSVAGRPALRVERVYRIVDGRPLQISATGLRARGLPEAQGAARQPEPGKNRWETTVVLDNGIRVQIGVSRPLRRAVLPAGGHLRRRPHPDLDHRRDQDDRGSAVRPPLKRVKASVHACIICVNGSVAPVASVAHVGGLSSALAASIWPSPAARRSSTAVCTSRAVRSCAAA